MRILIYYITYYIYLTIFEFNIFLNAFTRKIFNNKIIVIYIKNLFFYNKVIKNIIYKITT